VARPREEKGKDRAACAAIRPTGKWRVQALVSARIQRLLYQFAAADR